MVKRGYLQHLGEHTLFIKHSPQKKVISLIFYVDDIIVTGDDQRENLANKLEIKDLGSKQYFLGIELAQSKQGILILQQKYMQDWLNEIGTIGCKPVETPIEVNHKLGEKTEEGSVD